MPHLISQRVFAKSQASLERIIFVRKNSQLGIATWVNKCVLSDNKRCLPRWTLWAAAHFQPAGQTVLSVCELRRQQDAMCVCVCVCVCVCCSVDSVHAGFDYRSFAGWTAWCEQRLVYASRTPSCVYSARFSSTSCAPSHQRFCSPSGTPTSTCEIENFLSFLCKMWAAKPDGHFKLVRTFGSERRNTNKHPDSGLYKEHTRETPDRRLFREKGLVRVRCQFLPLSVSPVVDKTRLCAECSFRLP